MRRINLINYLLAALLAGGALSVQALELNGLYQAEMPVKTQTRDERHEVYPEALSQVIVRLSGNRQVLDRPGVSSVVARATSFVQRFHYDTLAEQQRLVLEEEGYTRRLVISFDGEALTKALVKAEVPLWGRTRPETLVWLAVEDREARYLLAAGASAELESHFDLAAARRGVPLMLPLLDLEDQAQVSFSDVWGNFADSVKEASERYGADAVLVGRLFRPADGGWLGRWSLYEGDVAIHWQADGLDQAEAIAAGVDGLADQLASRYAQLLSRDASGSVLVSVTEVGDLDGYARTLRYLGSLDVVSQVRVALVQGDEMLLRVDVRGEVGSLHRAIGLGSTLRRIEEAGARETTALTYQLLP